MITQLRTPTNPSSFSAAGYDFREREAKLAAREACARRSAYELFLWKQLSDVRPEQRGETMPHLPTFRAWEMFFMNGERHA
jgi:hypothetical protein